MIERIFGYVPLFLKYSGAAFLALFTIIGGLSLMVSPVEFMAWLAAGIVTGGAITGLGLLLENSKRAADAAEASRADARITAEATHRMLAELRRFRSE
jgi:hypothetical protein